jgi:predicted lysophospholipase L1 biosynthesis ABC-type transport system permease subunit
VDTIQRGSDGVADGGTAKTIAVGHRSIAVPRSAPEISDVTWSLKFPPADAPWLADLTTGDVTYWVSRDDASYQSILTALAQTFPGLDVQAGMKNPDQYADYRQQVGTVRAAIGLGIVLSVCSFLATTIENRWERSRSVSMLAAIGTRGRDLRTANLAEFAFPVAVAAVPAAVVGILGGWAVVSINGSDHMFTTGVAWASATGAAAAVLLATIVGWSTGNASFSGRQG